MVCRDEERQHRRHHALIEVVAKMGGGKQSYRFIIDLYGLRRGDRYLDHGTHESLYVPEEPDGGHPAAITPAIARKTERRPIRASGRPTPSPVRIGENLIY